MYTSKLNNRFSKDKKEVEEHEPISSVQALNLKTVYRLGPQVKKPQYDTEKVGQAWVHIGAGNFHRAHQAKYLDDILNNEGESEWGICGIGFFGGTKRNAPVFKSQDNLYSLLERTPEQDSLSVIGSIRDQIYAPEEREKALEKLASPQTKIVSLTVTEKGYYQDDEGNLNFDEEQVKYDIEHPDEPLYTYGFLIGGLDRRFKRGLKPYTILSCDNRQENGDTLKKAVVQFCQRRNPELAKWVEKNCAFPNSMVDRIAPIVNDETKELIKKNYGVDDKWPVLSEGFKQWVVQDTFPLGRPNLEKAGVTVVDDVHPFERMKLGILNLGHSAVAYYGVLSGLNYVHDAMNDDSCIQLLNYLVNSEIKPQLPHCPGQDPESYKNMVIERFRNENIADTLIRICSDGSGKIPTYLIPPLERGLEQGLPVRGLIFVLATWFRFLNGKNDQGEEHEIIDGIGEKLKELAQIGERDPSPFMEQKLLFGELGKNEYVMKELRAFMEDLYTIGAKKTMDKFLASV